MCEFVMLEDAVRVQGSRVSVQNVERLMRTVSIEFRTNVILTTHCRVNLVHTEARV